MLRNSQANIEDYNSELSVHQKSRVMIRREKHTLIKAYVYGQINQNNYNPKNSRLIQQQFKSVQISLITTHGFILQINTKYAISSTKCHKNSIETVKCGPKKTHQNLICKNMEVEILLCKGPDELHLFDTHD